MKEAGQAGGDKGICFSGSCGHVVQYEQMKDVILKRVPETKISGQAGRQASFEVEIEERPVYSKLQTMAFPDFEEVADVVEEVANGGVVRPIKKQQPINCCIQ